MQPPVHPYRPTEQLPRVQALLQLPQPRQPDGAALGANERGARRPRHVLPALLLHQRKAMRIPSRIPPLSPHPQGVGTYLQYLGHLHLLHLRHALQEVELVQMEQPRQPRSPSAGPDRRPALLPTGYTAESELPVLHLRLRRLHLQGPLAVPHQQRPAHPVSIALLPLVPGALRHLRGLLVLGGLPHHLGQVSVQIPRHSKRHQTVSAGGRSWRNAAPPPGPSGSGSASSCTTNGWRRSTP